MSTQPPQQDLYEEVPRDDVRPFIPQSARSALDVGCARGGFGLTLREILGDQARVVGIEAVDGQAQIARTAHGYDEVITGYFPGGLGDREERYDLICFNDVLEHVVDPWQMLRDTRAWLTPEGQILASIPSIQFAPIVWRLVRGRWDYLDYGTLDRTHLRFFTKATTIEMFEQNGFRVVRCQGANGLDDTWPTEPNVLKRLAKRALLTFLGDSRYIHFMVVAALNPDEA